MNDRSGPEAERTELAGRHRLPGPSGPLPNRGCRRGRASAGSRRHLRLELGDYARTKVHHRDISGGSSMNRIGCGMTRVNIGERDTSSPHVGQSNLRRLTASKSKVGLLDLCHWPLSHRVAKVVSRAAVLFAPNSQCGKVDVWRGNRRITASLGPRQTTGS